MDACLPFAGNVRRELWDIPIKTACCRRAFLYGLLLRAEPGQADGSLTLTLPVSRDEAPAVRERVTALLRRQLGCATSAIDETHGAHRYVRFEFASGQAAAVLEALRATDRESATGGDMAVEEAVAFGCSSCAAHFLRGAFLCAGSVSDPRRTHHLEFRLPDDGRAVCLADLCAACGMEPGITHRDGQCGIFFKRVESICDMLTQLGCVQQVFDILNQQMYNEKRAEEARATNWEAANIGRTVRAGQRQLNAIRRLAESHKLESLPPELQETARLRLEHAEVSLTELAALHTPPITKSRTESQTPENHTGGGGAVNDSISQQRSGTGKACAAPVFFCLVGLIRRKLLRVPQIRMPLPSICREREGYSSAHETTDFVIYCH